MSVQQCLLCSVSAVSYALLQLPTRTLGRVPAAFLGEHRKHVSDVRLRGGAVEDGE